MRSFLIVITGILLSYNVSAQMTGTLHGTSDRPFIYCEMGGGYGTHLTGGVGINAIFTNDNIVALSFYASTHRDPGAPSDFTKGLFETNPQQALYMIGLCYGKVFYTNHPSIRFTLKGGLSAGTVSTPTDYVAGGTLFSSNYTYSHQYQFTMGLLLNPTVEFPIATHFGFSCGLYANINFISPVCGLEGSILFGRLRNPKTQHRH